MKIAFALPSTDKIRVEYLRQGVKYQRVMSNPRDNGLLSIELAKGNPPVRMNEVLYVNEFNPFVKRG